MIRDQNNNNNNTHNRKIRAITFTAKSLTRIFHYFSLLTNSRITDAINLEKIKNPGDIPRPTVRVGSVVFRVNPYDPGIEKTVSELNQLIWGRAGTYFFILKKNLET